MLLPPGAIYDGLAEPLLPRMRPALFLGERPHRVEIACNLILPFARHATPSGEPTSWRTAKKKQGYRRGTWPQGHVENAAIPRLSEGCGGGDIRRMNTYSARTKRARSSCCFSPSAAKTAA